MEVARCSWHSMQGNVMYTLGKKDAIFLLQYIIRIKGHSFSLRRGLLVYVRDLLQALKVV